MPHSPKRNFANNLREARLGRGWTQQELGKRLGVAHTVISNYECGERTPRLNRLRKLARILKVELDDLV